jgi:CheY-like chemotaxis protein
MACDCVFVVEDQDLIRMILAEVLNDEGFHVVQASAGDEAAALIDGLDGFQAVVTDIHMPGERDGIAGSRHARRRHPTIPVIYCTGPPDALRRFLPAPADAG